MKFSEDEVIYSPTKIQKLTTAVVALSMCIHLVLPVFICYILVSIVGGNKGYGGCISVLFLFTLIFACCIAFYSKVKGHEVLGATIA